MVDRDFSPYPVQPNDYHPGEAAAEAAADEPAPKAPAVTFSAQGSAENYSDLVPAPEDLSAPVEKGSPQLPLETEMESPSQDSPKVTSPGAATPPAVTLPSGPAPTPSSQSVGK